MKPDLVTDLLLGPGASARIQRDLAVAACFRVVRFWWVALWLGTAAALVACYADWSSALGSARFFQPVDSFPWFRFPFACATIMVLAALDSGISNAQAPETHPDSTLRFIIVCASVSTLIGLLGLPSVPLETFSGLRHISFLTLVTILHNSGFQRVESASAKRISSFDP